MSTGPEDTDVKASSPKHESRRILACVLCQQRKVKCNRKFPCTNCIKSRVQCEPATLAPRKRRQQRPPEELIRRLGRYEELLRQHNIDFESPEGAATHEFDASHPKNGTLLRVVSKEDSSPYSPAESSVSDRIPRPLDFWDAIRHNSGRSDADSDDSEDNVRKDVADTVWNTSLGREYALLGHRADTLDLSSLRPDTALTFRLWQAYIENVDPLFKVTHTPSLQARLVGGLADSTPVFEALKFSIYCIAVFSVPRSDCVARFGSSKDELLARYQYACQQALLNANFLRTCNLECLTALFLYLYSLCRVADYRSLSSLLAIATSIARRMGLASESSHLRCRPFEAELRRRLWWSLILFETRIGAIADNNWTSLLPSWDCRVPLSVNDSELRPDMETPPTGQSPMSDASFVVVSSELGDLTRHSTFHTCFTSPEANFYKLQKGPPPPGGEVNAIERTIVQKYLQYCNPANPLQNMTRMMIMAHLSRFRLVEYLSTVTANMETFESKREVAQKLGIELLEKDNEIIKTAGNYAWFAELYFPLPSYVLLCQSLKKRAYDEMAALAWRAMWENYSLRFCGSDLEREPYQKTMVGLILSTWNSQERLSPGTPPTPEIILAVKDTLSRTQSGNDNGQSFVPAVTPQSFDPLAMSLQHTAAVSSFSDFPSHDMMHIDMGQSLWGATYEWTAFTPSVEPFAR